MGGTLYGLDDYHVLLTVTGLTLLAALWLPRAAFRRPPAASAPLMLLGCAGFALAPGMPQAIDPVRNPLPWEVIAELIVIVVLFATGLRIDELRGWRLWSGATRLLAVAMPLTIGAVALLGWSVAGMSVAGAVLLGAALAPTDPVLAGEVQVGPPLEGGEHPVRFTLTTEAGLNDGLAFPFVHLAVLMATLGADPALWLGDWLLRDVLYRIAVGAAGGAAAGWALGRALFGGSGRLSQGGPGVVALAGTLFAYGAVELAEGYGFIAAFVAGATLRAVERDHEYHRRLHDFAGALEDALTSVLLVLLGGALPLLWPALDWRHAAVGLALILLVRPLAGWLSLWGEAMPARERAVVAFYGVRGVGSVYYLAYATGKADFPDAPALWATVAFTVFASTVIHGGTARLVVDRVAPAEGPDG
jgi:NhaP-type Na+/H+ or K+/H+ antiporter